MIKIIHISDLHFGRHIETIPEAFHEACALIQPDLLIISGDLTQRARSWQFKALAGFLARLRAPYLVVPGNHDIPLFNSVARLFWPFKQYRRSVSPELEVSFSNAECRILGLNSVAPYELKDGRLSRKSMAKMKAFFQESDHRLNILFFHHNFHYFEGMHNPLINTQEFIDYLKQSPIDIVCTGHLHFANITLIEKNNQDNAMILHAGSLSCVRTQDKFNSFYVINQEGLACGVDKYVFNKGQFIPQEKFNIEFSR
ncbi:metallophosphoesterase family protein [Legionella taurinensis]|uniref:metallophosphoesterase family protein n=1 Tax=Legionella taurinensis TaxID=70611 RepID=UPI000DF9566B|nr:metallophosphoesterase [Legionella taurinensis]MDX1838598.1 metallophosphoesterase [Legionella taurinensis]STY27113.1 3',5'-cyclic-nucleotide phosphodiesterase [Legionella taurinensis]